MAAPLVLSCLPQDLDAATMTCAAPFYSAPASALPSLSIEDARAIGLAFAFLLAVAWGIRQVRRQILSG